MSDNIVDVKDEMKGNNVDMHVCEKYALNHKTWHFIFDYNFGNLNRFYSFYIILIVNKFYMWL